LPFSPLNNTNIERGAPMANSAHLTCFQEGADIWNRWRSADSEIAPDLSGILATQADLSGFDLSHANLARADFSNVHFGDCDLTEASLREAILRNADLTGVRGLTQLRQVAGADLSGAYLPNSLKDAIGGLDVAKGISGNAQKLFVVVLGACFYSWLTIGTTTDFSLITNRSSSPLPILQTAIPIVDFYIIAPLLLLGIFFYFHLYLQKLWDELGAQPAIFPDGRPLQAKADPWLISDLVQSHLYRLRNQLPVLAYLQVWIARLVAWWFVPLTLAGFWLRYLPRHNLVGTAFHCVLITVSVAGASSFYRLAGRTLRGVPRQRFSWCVVRLSYESWKPIWVALLSGLSIGLISLSTIDGVRQRAWLQPSHSSASWVPAAFSKIGYSPFANLTGAELSTKPANWSEKNDPNLDNIVGFELHGGDLRYSDMPVTFLPKANLSADDLEGAELTAADLRKAHLARANLKRANLEGTHLDNADLTRADLSGANLFHTEFTNAQLLYTDFQNATGFDAAEAQKGNNWCEAQYPPAVLRAFNLAPAYNQRIQAHEKRDVNLELASAKAKEIERLREIQRQHPDASLDELVQYSKSAAEGSPNDLDKEETPPRSRPSLKPILWPKDQAPIPAPLPGTPSAESPLPTADYLVISWTVAETRALADVLTPGYGLDSWYRYGRLFNSKFKTNLSPESPAVQLGSLGRYFPVKVGNQTVLCFKSDLHFITDGPSVPLLALLLQIFEEVKPKMIITTGSAGALSGNFNIGDVVISSKSAFRCFKFCKQEPFGDQEFSSDVSLPSEQLDFANKNLMQANWSQLEGERMDPPFIFWTDKQVGGPAKVITADQFVVADVRNTYGIDGLGAVTENNDALVGLASIQLGDRAPKWLSIRNVFPVMCGDSILQARVEVARLYMRYAYWTSIQSAIATWAVISGSR
jgi:uncharacterized protein YjbI with pentapeptide repeats